MGFTEGTCFHPRMLPDFLECYIREVCQHQDTWANPRTWALGASPDCALMWSRVVPHGVDPVKAGCGDSLSTVWEVTDRVMADTQGSTILPQLGQNSVLVVPVGSLEKASPTSTSKAFKTQSFVGTAPHIFKEL